MPGEEKRSSDHDRDERTLALSTSDYVAAAVKAVLGATPFVGSLLTELAGVIIPNQRIDRVVKFAKVLEGRLSHLEQDSVRSQLTNEHFSDLMEEGLRQAARSLTDERREYIASVVGTSLSTGQVEYIESKHLLRILGEINDIEVIILRSYAALRRGDEEFWAKHKAILETITPMLGAEQDVIDKAALQQSYREHLAQLGLLQHRYRTDRDGNPVFDRISGTPQSKGYEITSFGRLLLRRIELEPKRR